MMATEARRLTMPCDIESRRSDPQRRAAWHKDCPDPLRCECPAHDRDAADTTEADDR